MKLLKYFTALLMLIITSLSHAQQQSSSQGKGLATLSISPKGCVALRKGQICYQQTSLTWEHAIPGDYCIIQWSNKSILKCWKNQTGGQFSFDFQSTQDEEYVLAQRDSQEVLSRTRMVVSWVFKSSKRPKSSWRLF
jgi:hypothetical protein